MTDNIINFAEAQEKAKDIVAEILGKNKPIENVPVPYLYGSIDPLVHSSWVTCFGCASRIKLTMDLRKFLGLIGNVIIGADQQRLQPIALFYQNCEQCGHKNGYTVTNINVQACETQEDGTPWTELKMPEPPNPAA